MSASLLNFAAVPGQAPGAQGIAQQGAHAGHASGPLAGFEALLAAFFGDQGLTAPLIPGQAQAAGAGQSGAGGKGSNGKDSKTADAKGADKADAAPAAAADATAAAVDASALTLAAAAAATPQIQPAQQTPVQAQGDEGGDEDAQGHAKGPSAPAVLGQLAAAAVSADAKAAKGLAIAVQKTADAGPPADTPPSTDAAKAAQASPAAKTPAAQTAPVLPQTPALSSQPAAVAAQTLAPPGQPVDAQARAGQQAAASEPKEKAATVKTARVEGAPTASVPAGASTKSADVVPAAGDAAGKDAGAEEHEPNAPAAGAEDKPAAADSNTAQPEFTLTSNAAAANNPQALAHAAALVRGAPQTVANLAAQIAKKLDGRSTRFDVQLDPAGLGKVDVRVEIDAAGKMSAALNFDNQQAAAELKSRAGELQRALEQAGFDLSGGLSFDVSGQGQQQAQGHDDTPNFRGRAFQAVLEGGGDAAVAPQASYSSAPRAGVDIRI